jgi:hypothetical protein
MPPRLAMAFATIETSVGKRLSFLVCFGDGAVRGKPEVLYLVLPAKN